MNYEFELTEENVKDSLVKDTLKRNSKINNLLKLINTLNKNTIITIDGAWGTGKTVFVKQIEGINHFDFNDEDKEIKLPNIDKLIKENFNNNHIVYYYNAWENDNHQDPLLSIIYKLINDFPKMKSKTKDLKPNKIPINLKKFLQTWSQDLIQATDVETLEELVKNIYTVEEQKEAFNNLLNSLIPSDKKIVIIIDELDRCNPKFAVDIIETIKHFYDNDKIIFLISSNNEQLSHTISKFYGDYFDGYGYLNKIFNFIISLEKVDVHTYINFVLKKTTGSGYLECMCLGVSEYFDFSMREIGRYMYYVDTLSNYYYKTDYFRDDNELVKLVFLPYCIALKLKDIKIYNDFVNGNDYNDFLSFYNKNTNCKKIVDRIYNSKISVEDKEKISVEKYIVDIFERYFENLDEDSYRNKEVRKSFLDVLSMISNFSEF